MVQSSFAVVLTDFVKHRYPDVPNIDLVADVAGSTLAAALVVGVESWGRNGCREDLSEITAECLGLLRSGLARLPSVLAAVSEIYVGCAVHPLEFFAVTSVSMQPRQAS